MADADPAATFIPLLKAADALGLAYVHLVDVADSLGWVRANWTGNLIANNGLKPGTAAALLDGGAAQAVSFGRYFISNPDLVARLRRGAELARVDRDHIYTGEAKGYTDYPAMA